MKKPKQTSPDPLQIIDDVLKIINDLNEKTGKYAPLLEIYSTSTGSYISRLPSLDQLVILKKLEKDKMIDSRPAIQSIDLAPDETPMYLITFEGVLFLRKGGYTEQNRQQKSSANLQTILTWVIAGGAFVAALFAGLDYFHQVFHC
jgi:hypothetical protein